MERKRVIPPDILKTLTAIPQQQTHQHTSYEPPLTAVPTPPRKSFGGRAWDKATEFGRKAKVFCESLSEVLVPVTKLITRATKLILAVIGLKKAFEKAYA